MKTGLIIWVFYTVGVLIGFGIGVGAIHGLLGFGIGFVVGIPMTFVGRYLEGL